MKKRALVFLVLLLITLAVIGVEVALGVRFNLGVGVILGMVVVSVIPLLVFQLLPYFSAGWVDRVLREGAPATALVHENNVLQGVGHYQGGDQWVELPVSVQPAGEPPFEARMKCRLTQITFGMVNAGSQVPVRYDLQDRTKVVLVGEPNDLLALRAQG